MNSTVRNYTLAGIAIGLLFPLTAWLADSAMLGHGIGVGAIIEIHREHPFHFIIDSIPVLLGFTFFRYGRLRFRHQGQLEEKARQAQRQLAEFVSASLGRVWETDENHLLTYIASGGDPLLEASAKDALGRPRWESPGLSAPAEAWERHREQLGRREPFRDFRCTLKLPDGQLRHLSISGDPIIDEHGGFRGYRGTAADITRQVQVETSLEESERKYRRLFEFANDSMFIIDPDTFEFVDVNYAAAERLGYTVDELIGMHAGDVNPDYDAENLRQLYDRAREQGNVTFETVHRRKDGALIPMELNSHYVDVGGRQLVETIGRDITERKRMEEMKSEFISTVSHELRTPLTSIVGSLGLLQSGQFGDMSDQATQMLRLAHKNSERLIHLVNDILDIERIQSGHMVLEPETVDLNALVEQAIAENAAYADQFGVILAEGRYLPNAAVTGDRHRLLQVMANLLSNAAKFSPPGGRVDVTLTANGDDLRVSVSDKGPGIKPGFKNRIFEKFMQSDMSDSKEKGGTGLGLSITKAIVEMHGGRVGFENNPDGGATFFFDLPRERDSQAAAE